MNDFGQIALGDGFIHWLCEEWDGAREETALLAPAEAAAFAALRSDKRRRDWLLGRRVAKRLVQRVLAAAGPPPPLSDIAILSHPDGWPYVILPDATPALTLSISHSHDHAFGALALGHRPLGCDLEYVEPRSPGFVADYFTGEERALVATAAEERRPTLANAIWSGKEAALKAIRRGLAEDTRLVSCLPQEVGGAAEAWRPLLIRWQQPERNLPALMGWWRAAGEYVLTLATGDPSRDGADGAP